MPIYVSEQARQVLRNLDLRTQKILKASISDAYQWMARKRVSGALKVTVAPVSSGVHTFSLVVSQPMRNYSFYPVKCWVLSEAEARSLGVAFLHTRANPPATSIGDPLPAPETVPA